MGIILRKQPELENPILIACWPGIGNIGILAVDTLRGMFQAEELGEIEPWDFFYPKRVVIRNGELKYLEFPTCKFHFKRTGTRDLVFFIGEEQPAEAGKAYAEATKAYEMANLVMDVAQELGCQRLYTAGAAVSLVHHTASPRVWAVPNSEALVDEVRAYPNTVLMSDVEGRGGEGSITGLNGLLLGAARARGVEGISLLGEIPMYLQTFPFPYPKASKAVLEVLSVALGIEIPLDIIDTFVQRSESEIEQLYDSFPPEIKGQLEELKATTDHSPTEPGPITEEDKRSIMQDIDDLFRKDERQD